MAVKRELTPQEKSNIGVSATPFEGAPEKGVPITSEAQGAKVLAKKGGFGGLLEARGYSGTTGLTRAKGKPYEDPSTTPQYTTLQPKAPSITTQIIGSPALTALNIINEATMMPGMKEGKVISLVTPIGVGKARIATNTKKIGLIKSVLNKVFTTKKTVTYVNQLKGTTSVVDITTASMVKPLAIVGTTLLAVGWLLEKSLGGKNIGRFVGEEEAAQAAGMAVWMAQSADDYDTYLAARALQEEALNPENRDNLKSYVPYANFADGLDNYANITLAAGKIMDKIMYDKETGESDEDKWARINQEKLDSEQASIDYYNEERKKLVQWELDAKAEQRDDDATFWAAEAEKQRILEEEDRQAIADFWLNYKKMTVLLQDVNRPSNLKFGLL